MDVYTREEEKVQVQQNGLDLSLLIALAIQMERLLYLFKE
jgi:hypothetical protein